LVDADPNTRKTLTLALQRDDRTLQTSTDSKDVLERLRAVPCDLLVAGNGHNGLDPLKLLRKAREIRPDLKVLVSGDPDPQRVLEAIRDHAFGYFHQPVTPAAVAELAQQALNADHWEDDLQVVSGRAEWITLEIRCRMQAVERTTHHLREFLPDIKQQASDDIAIAFRELLMNAVEHGGKYDPAKRVRISLLRASRAVIVHIADPGTGFSLEFLPHAAISNPAGDPTRHLELRTGQGQRPGGFGILMSRQLVDDLLYNERGNAVLFVKYL
jgi:anti-sigma regulatory factor (Ser/Thr protein kinase)/CheY-like chemotaxis protein